MIGIAMIAASAFVVAATALYVALSNRALTSRLIRSTETDIIRLSSAIEQLQRRTPHVNTIEPSARINVCNECGAPFNPNEPTHNCKESIARECEKIIVRVNQNEGAD